MVWFLRLLNVIFLVFAFFNPKIGFISLGLLFLFSGLRKVFILGADSLRGRFWILLSFNGLLFPLAEIIDSFRLHLVSRLYLTICLAFMFVGLLREGLHIRGLKSIAWLVFVALIILLTFIFLPFIHTKDIPHYAVLVLFDINFAILFADFLLYLGSDLGIRWFIGLFAFLFFFVGDVFWLLDNFYFTRLFWSFIFFFVNIMAHIEE